ncbi:antibiotic biosynthesis monooxygenase [Halieaceae bacterium IMCC8485]|uniref:Antibiotic biosynthesis monooxygenase n=1 Tax=Candidatus Seongchinamella marina TaxID=2518990 RepID=A0ABT3T0W7_9GAMM|nr:antibiotic biosynthesis monooxygenase [Candidatus Seongchinamella marina]MCX2975515.1 antibiotic biosynthesis monooxygenase [Candidatus Seongchinamella marina]
MSASVDSGPVTISIERRVVKGRESEFEAWVSGITVEALKFQGHMGVNVIRPGSGSSNYVTIFRFDDYEHSKTWEGSDVRREWLDKLGDIIEGDAKIMKGTGLEFWFDLPELPVVRPSPHKMALVLFFTVYAMLLVINTLLAPFVQNWTMELRLLAGVMLQVPLMTYLVMPQVTRLLQNWLFK